MNEGRGPVIENRLKRLVKQLLETRSLKNRSRSGLPKLSPEATEPAE